LKVEDDIEFANIPIVFVHLFNITMHDLESDQFIVRGSASGDEEKRSIATIDNLCVCG